MVWFFITILLLFLVGGFVLLTRVFLGQIGDLRRENQQLLNRLLLRHNVEPIQIEREQVVKLPDPEVQPRTWLDDVMRADAIKEEIERVHPDAAQMTLEEVMATYPHDWKRFEAQWNEQHTPLRAE